MRYDPDWMRRPKWRLYRAWVRLRMRVRRAKV